ncbi:hypothetical protein [Dyadobacter helix]|nr:hypothetical protein [Dyadobacter sp. CECT 9275]
MKLSRIIAKTFFASAMLLTSTSIFAQVKIGTNPTTIEAASNLEVEASTAGRKVKVDKTTGQLTIKDGTEGAGKILKSDAVGGASWQTEGPQNSPVIFSVTNGPLQELPLRTFIRINFENKNLDKNNVFDLSSDSFTIPVGATGYYEIAVRTTTPHKDHDLNCYVWAFVNGVQSTLLGVGNSGPGSGVIVSGSVILQLNAGDVVDLRAWTDKPDVGVSTRNLFVNMLSK